MAGPPGIEPLTLNTDATLKSYFDFCVVNRGMQPRVAKDYRQIARRFLNSCKGVVSEQTVREYLSYFLTKKPKTYNNQLEGLRSFVGRYLNHMDIMQRFKRVWQPTNYERTLPTKEQLRKGFDALTLEDENTLYLLYASSGLRKSEALKLEAKDVDKNIQCIKPQHDTRTKKSGVAFYNEVRVLPKQN